MLHQEIVLIHLVSILFGGRTLLDNSGRDVHIWFTVKYISHATNCNSLHFAGLQIVEGMVTEWRESPVLYSIQCLIIVPFLCKEQESHCGLVCHSLFLLVFFQCVSNLEKMTVIRLRPELRLDIRQLLICLLMDLRCMPPECCYLPILVPPLTKHLQLMAQCEVMPLVYGWYPASNTLHSPYKQHFSRESVTSERSMLREESFLKLNVGYIDGRNRKLLASYTTLLPWLKESVPIFWSWVGVIFLRTLH